MDHLTTLSTALPTVAIVIDDPQLRQCFMLRVPGSTQAEGYAFLETVSSGAAGAGGRQLLMGSTFEPIRQMYAAHDAQIAAMTQSRLAALGPKPTVAQLTELAQWASQQRANSARLWRLPTGPDIGLMLEARDWQKYGTGGRTLPNLMNRNLRANPGLSTEQNLRRVIGTVGKTNPEVNLGVLRTARALRAGGSVLLVAGLGLTAYEYSQTPQAQRSEFLKREGAGFVGGAVAAGLATALVLTFGLPGLVVIGIGVVAGMAGAWAGQQIYLAASGSGAQTQAHGTGIIQASALPARK
jgi:hypothetical protein